MSLSLRLKLSFAAHSCALKPSRCCQGDLSGGLVQLKKCPLRHRDDLLAAPVITAVSLRLILTVISGAGAELAVMMTRAGNVWSA